MCHSLISIIVPVYNIESYIANCLDSILNQTYPNLEIIVVDDASTDNSGKIIDKYAKHNFQSKIIHKQHGGLSDSRNIVMQASHGSYIGFVDGDDMISPHMYEFLLESLLLQKNDFVLCSYEKFSGDEFEFYTTHY
ncbi:glycosyltransferase family 2 protein [Anaerostipes faecalis]|uniref:glycosyltransferase family 2 protein n=1 Tax=Anaerostipes faecalis TaxID=2738446 RepID=UPI003F0EC089